MAGVKVVSGEGELGVRSLSGYLGKRGRLGLFCGNISTVNAFGRADLVVRRG